MSQRAFFSWSGGKDAMLALHRALAAGVRVEVLLTPGYGARVVCVDARRLDASFCGREFDAAFLADPPEAVVACGENGEFHTFVFDGPRVAQPVAHERVAVHEIRQSAPALGHHVVAELR